jgi:hypothetical protein
LFKYVIERVVFIGVVLLVALLAGINRFLLPPELSAAVEKVESVVC